LTFLAGNATDEAIKNALLNEVDGVTSASVTSNRNLLVDGEGRPGKSFEAVVEGGTDADIALEIWETMPSGIEPFGSTTEIIIDSQGNNQTIKFSRPTPLYIHIKVKRAFNTEEPYPSDGDQQIKDNIVAWAALNINVGDDVIRQRISDPVYDVPGIGTIEITIDDTPNPGDAPTLLEQNIIVASREFAVFATSRITVEIYP